MKYLFFLFLLVILQDIPETIANYKTHNRLILIFSVDNRSDLYNQTLLQLARDPLGMDKNDVVIFEVFKKGGLYPDGSALTENDAGLLWSYFNLNSEHFAIILLNKDSREVLRSSVPLKAAEIIRAFENDKI